jgi:hypothetical protein
MDRRGWFRVRVGVLLAALAVAGVQWLRVRSAESWRPDWTRTQHVSVVLLVPRTATPDEAEQVRQIQLFVRRDDETATFRALEGWVRSEHARYAPTPRLPVVSLSLVGPIEVATLPPQPPGDEALGFKERYDRTRSFLAYYEDLRARNGLSNRMLTVFVSFYGEADVRLRSIHSVADRRSRTGFVFAKLDARGSQHAVIDVAHELFHLFGASDKYRGEQSVFPQGYVEPWKVPRLPQTLAEVMAQGIPLDGGKERTLDRFEDMRVGVETAWEIGWIDRERRDRYYRGDASAGPREK